MKLTSMITVGSSVKILKTAAAITIAGVVSIGTAGATNTDITVYKDPQCPCCNKWIDHLKSNGFQVKINHDVRMEDIKTKHGLPVELGSCHTAIIDGYVVEGHVPASTIQRLLRERPPVKGIGVAGMPPGSPGMESATPKPYNVMSFDAAGKTKIYEQQQP